MWRHVCDWRWVLALLRSWLLHLMGCRRANRLPARARGGAFDAFVSNPDVNDYPLEAITDASGVLLVHAQDDPLTSYGAAVRAAGRIPGARLVTLPSGGHLLLGQDDVVGRAISVFLAEPITTPGTGATEGDDADQIQPNPTRRPHCPA
jgi:pimeloyl-ACP methyl ester carboxylesterase